MKLLLTSAGITNQSIVNVFRDLVGKPFETLNLVFVPTAANAESGDKGWLVDDMKRFYDLAFAKFDIVDISALPKDVWEPRLSDADILVFGGGNTYHLMYWLEKSGLKQQLSEMLRDKIYVGISAGSMVTVNNVTLSDSQTLYFEKTGDVATVEGLGFVDFTIRPHLNSQFFTNMRLPIIEKIAKGIQEPLYAIDDATAIVVDNGKTTVVSEGTWKEFNKYGDK